MAFFFLTSLCICVHVYFVHITFMMMQKYYIQCKKGLSIVFLLLAKKWKTVLTFFFFLFFRPTDMGPLGTTTLFFLLWGKCNCHPAVPYLPHFLCLKQCFIELLGFKCRGSLATTCLLAFIVIPRNLTSYTLKMKGGRSFWCKQCLKSMIKSFMKRNINQTETMP